MEPHHHRPSGDPVSTLSRAIVRAVADHTGRGPTKVGITLGHDVICVVMRGNHTKGERALMAMGEERLVLDLRRAYHQTMEPALLAAARTMTGQEVDTVLASHDPAHDVSTFTFVLAPVTDNGSSTAAPAADQLRPRPVNGSAEPALNLS